MSLNWEHSGNELPLPVSMKIVANVANESVLKSIASAIE